MALLDRRQVGHRGHRSRRRDRLASLQLRLAELRDLDQQVDAPEQDVDMLRLKDQFPFLRRDETVFHRVGDPDRGVEPDDPRRPFERVCRRISGSITSGVADVPSSATRPADSVAVWLSASMRKVPSSRSR